MSAPKTPLMVAPSATDPVGKAIPSSELLHKLFALNARLFCPDVDDSGHIEAWHGVTSLWLGAPGGGGRPICGIKLGLVPEWTIVGEDGLLISKGWRAIFDKIIKAGGARREDLERTFGVSLGDGSVDASLCRRCIRDGKRVPSNGGAARLCDLHDDVYSGVDRARMKGPELAEKAGWRKEKEIVC